MFVRSYLIVLILGCCLCGLGLFARMSQLHHDFEHATNQVSRDSLALRDLARLEDGFSQWVILSDLILDSGETYLGTGALGLAENLTKLLRQIERNPLGKPNKAEIAALGTFFDRQSDRLKEAKDLNEETREADLVRLSAAMKNELAASKTALQRLPRNVAVLLDSNSTFVGASGNSVCGPVEENMRSTPTAQVHIVLL